MWATLRVIDACLELSPEQLETAVPGTYGSILDTVRHLVGADSWYLFDLTADPARRIEGWQMDLGRLRDAMEADGPAWSALLVGDPDPEVLVHEVDEDDGFERDAPIGIRLSQALTTEPTTGARSAPPSRRSGWNRCPSTSGTSACTRAV